jgi:hypothetical protein
MPPRGGPTEAEGRRIVNELESDMGMNQASGISLALMAFCSLMALCGLGMCDVVVNEVELSPPDNGTVWVELYNSGDAAVDLTGWMVRIEDKPWIGPIQIKGTIEPKGFFVAEGQPNWATTGNGTIFLIDSSGSTVDKTPMLNDDGQNDFTNGRLPDGKKTDTNADFAFMFATKGRSNGRSVLA